MDFDELLARVFAEGYEGDAAAELSAAYGSAQELSAAAYAEAITTSEAVSAEFAAAQAEHAAEVQRLQAANYVLLTQTGGESANIDAPEEEQEDGIETIDDLFSELADSDD